MALNMRQIQLPQRRVPLEQIVAVRGQNPLATGIEQAGALVGKALERRAELRRQGQVVAALANAAGEQNPNVEGIDPGSYETLLRLKTDRNAKVAQAAKDRVAQELALEKLRSGYSEYDPATQTTRTYPGVQDFNIKYDAAGNPYAERGPSYGPAMKPKSMSGGSNQGGYFTPRGVDAATNQPVYSHSKQPGLFYADMTPYKGGAPGAFTLKSLPSDQITQESSLATLDLALKNINDSFNSDLVGPVASRVGKGKQYVEGLATPEATNFYSNVADLRNQILYLRTGKQINETEYQRLLAAVPNENMSPTDFRKRLANTQKLIKTIIESRAKALSGSGYRGASSNLPQIPSEPQNSNSDPLGLFQ